MSETQNKMMLLRFKNGGDTTLQKIIRIAFLFSKKKKVYYENQTNQKVTVCDAERQSYKSKRSHTQTHQNNILMYTERQEILQNLLCFYLSKSNKLTTIIISIVLFLLAFFPRKHPKLVKLRSSSNYTNKVEMRLGYAHERIFMFHTTKIFIFAQHSTFFSPAKQNVPHQILQ